MVLWYIIVPWQFHELINIVPLQFHYYSMHIPWHDTSMTNPWRFHDNDNAIRWQFNDNSMTKFNDIPWQSSMTIPWKCHANPTIKLFHDNCIRWLFHDNSITVLWKAHVNKNTVMTIWLFHCDFLITYAMVTHEMTIAWLFTWWSHNDDSIVVPWQFHEKSMTLPWLLHDYAMTIPCSMMHPLRCSRAGGGCQPQRYWFWWSSWQVLPVCADVSHLLLQHPPLAIIP